MNRFLTISMCAMLTALTPVAPVSVASAAETTISQTQPSAAPHETALLKEILQLSNSYFSRFPFMRAEDVHSKIVTSNDNSYLLVSVQSPAEYARGHVPGALNIPLSEIASPKSLALFPHGKKIVFTCDNGHRSMEAALFLGQLGYETYVLSMGLSHWNGAESGIAATSLYPGSAGYPVSTATASSPYSTTLPAITGTGKNGREAIIEQTGTVLARKGDLFIDRSEVYEKAVKGGDTGYFLVSLQRPDDYAKGHVPGAINIPFNEIATVENLQKLPRDKKIVLICYVGHWAGSAALFLNQLGYDAYDMRFGTLGWNNTTDGLGEAKDHLVSLERSLNLPVEKGTGTRVSPHL